MSFEDSCKRLNIEPRELSFFVAPWVYDDLVLLAENNDSSLDEFLRDMVDYFLSNQPE